MKVIKSKVKHNNHNEQDSIELDTHIAAVATSTLIYFNKTLLLRIIINGRYIYFVYDWNLKCIYLNL